MLALLFTLAMLGYWGLVGFALLTLFPPRLKPLTQVLLSPVVGVACIVVALFLINRLGVPVKDFAIPLALVLAAGAGLILYLKKPEFPLRTIAPFGAALLAGAILAAWPMLLYGFNWVSFSNDDMANYSLAAKRFLEHGFFDRPDLKAFFEGRDYSQAFWFMHVGFGQRSGSELMLAFAWGVTGLNAHQIFMPVIMGLNLALAMTTASLIAERDGQKFAPLIALVLIVLSPLTSVGALYQLIGQVGGLALLCGALTLALREQPAGTVRALVTQNMCAAIVFAGLMIWYPEVLPFFGLAWILYALVSLQIGVQPVFQRIVLPAIAIGAVSLILVNVYARDTVLFVFSQRQSAFNTSDVSDILFPYFLIPSGMAAVWGLLPIANPLTEPFGSIAILGGLLLSVWALWRLPGQVIARSAPALVTIVMIALGLVMFFQKQDFATFKLAMYAQPFLAAFIAIEVAKPPAIRFQLLQRGAAGLVMLACLASQYNYVRKSTGEFPGSLNEIPNASRLHVNEQFKNQFALRTPKPMAILDTPNVVMAKFNALYTEGVPTLFPSRTYFVQVAASMVALSRAAGREAPPEFLEFDKLRELSIPGHTLGANEFSSPAALKEAVEKATVFSAPRLDFLNGFYAPRTPDYFVQVNDLSTHLIFVNSKLGNHYYLPDKGREVSFYQLEADPMMPGRQFSALGRYMMLTILEPPPQGARAVLEMTSTVLPQFDRVVAPASMQGVSFGAVGRGSARLFSPPLTPSEVAGLTYVTLDLGRSGKQFPSAIQGLEGLYGRDIPRDRRKIAALGSDISLISNAAYAALPRPSALVRFPADLANKGLEYSGIYEDGWIAERSFFVLHRPESAKFLLIRGEVPAIEPGFSLRLTATLDGKIVVDSEAKPGRFEFWTPVSGAAGDRRIDLSFSKFQRLPGTDGRPVSAKIDTVGFVKARAPGPLEEAATPLPAGLGDSKLAHAGIYDDRWVAPRAFVEMTAKGGNEAVVLKGMTPQINDPQFSAKLSVSVDGALIAEREIKTGDFEWALPVSLSPGVHRIDLSFDRGQVLPGGDGRLIGARFERIALQPAAKPR